MVARGTPWVRRINERRIVSELLTSSSLSRAQLAKRTGLSAPTVGKVVDDLVSRGLLQEGGAGSPAASPSPGKARRLGRPSRPVSLQSVTPRFVAVELSVGRTSLSALPVAGPGEGGWQARFPTPGSGEDWCRALGSAAAELGRVEPWAVLLSVPGVCDERAARVLLSPNLHWTENADLPALVGRVWNVPVLMVQEIRALALGHLKAGGGAADFLHVDFGTGVGGALVRGGELYEGSVVLSGELGHTPVLGNPRPCGCGSTGCVETLVSRPGLLRSYSEMDPSQVFTWDDLVARVAEHGLDPWLQDSLDAMGVVVGGALNVTGLTQVVITGALADLPSPAVARMARQVERSAMWARFGEVRVSAAPRRRAEGLVTAALDRFLLPLENGEDAPP